MSKNQIKATIRQTYLKTRASLSYIDHCVASYAVCAHILSLKEYQQAKRVAFYMAINREIDLSPLWHEFKTNQKIYFLPKMAIDNTLSFLPATAHTPFLKNKLGILEPNVDTTFAINLLELDIIFMPLVAFDEQGTRLGMGGGYYDRTLANNTSSLRIGVAYDIQKQAFIHSDPWDITLNAVVTQSKTYWFK